MNNEESLLNQQVDTEVITSEEETTAPELVALADECETDAEQAVEILTIEECCEPAFGGKLVEVVECLLFVVSEPLSSMQIAEVLHIECDQVIEALDELDQRLLGTGGLQLMRVAGGFQLCTKSEYAEYCSIILQPAQRKLSKAGLETLAIIAYRQPCTVPEIESVRGVSVGGVVKTLLERGLVREAGKKHAPGRPTLYATTEEFLQYFGLNELGELPDIDELAIEEVKALEAQRELFESSQEQHV